MSYKQIDKQFMKKFEYISCGYHCSQPDFDDLKSFLNLIYDQAKAEQREEDARIAEGKKIAVTYLGIIPEENHY